MIYHHKCCLHLYELTKITYSIAVYLSFFFFSCNFLTKEEATEKREQQLMAEIDTYSVLVVLFMMPSRFLALEESPIFSLEHIEEHKILYATGKIATYNKNRKPVHLFYEGRQRENATLPLRRR